VFVRVEQKTGENPAVRYQYDNHLGSACLELDELGAIISYEEYHPFGTTSYRSGRTQIEVALKRYKYCGKERDEETGLYYYGARYYAAWLAKFISCDPLQHEYPHYTPYQYAGNKPITYIDLDGLEEEKKENTSGILYINTEGVEIGTGESEERRIFLVYDEAKISAISESAKNNEMYDYKNLADNEYFELPPYEIRQEIKDLIANAYQEKDLNTWVIADFEIGGQIDHFQETDFMSILNEGFVNRSWVDGEKVKSNTEVGYIANDIDENRDPLLGKEFNVLRIKWKWHTHLNVFWTKEGEKITYQRHNRDNLTNFSNNFINGNFSGEKGFGPSEHDYDILAKLTTGIVFDMKNDNAYLYNSSKTTKALSFNVFFNIK
jgi:RHS repeat-associated protein